jgi:carbohydrate kinase (thermoresistant glucokinase family)
MGVAGSGKTTIAQKLTEGINAFLIEADDYHSKNNIKKMSSGIPLNDEDRYDWLVKIREEIIKRQKTQNLVVTCSALKEKYRSILNVKNYYLVYLKINKETARKRINNRRDHFMPDSLVESQFSILEEPKKAITLDQSLNPDEMVNQLISIFKDSKL